MAPQVEVLHASAVSFDACAVVILGPAGSGKSSLALELLSLGAALIADDRVQVSLCEGKVIAQRPKNLPPWIEARGIGFLRAITIEDPVEIGLCVDMAHTETERLPPPRRYLMLGQEVPLLHNCDARYFPAAIKTYLSHGPAPI